MICSYCETEQIQNKKCSFCSSDLTANRPKTKKYLSENEAYLDQPTLATYHTYDLMLLIQHLRSKRSEAYKLMQTVRNAPDEASIPNDIILFGQSEYRRFTAHLRVIESILIDRLGYKPKRIDRKLLDALKSKIERS